MNRLEIVNFASPKTLNAILQLTKSGIPKQNAINMVTSERLLNAGKTAAKMDAKYAELNKLRKTTGNLKITKNGRYIEEIKDINGNIITESKPLIKINRSNTINKLKEKFIKNN